MIFMRKSLGKEEIGHKIWHICDLILNQLIFIINFLLNYWHLFYI